MNEDGINRQGWFAISLGLVFIIGLFLVLIGGDTETPINNQPTTGANPPKQARTSSPQLNPQQAQEKTRELNLIQNLIQRGLTGAERVGSGIASAGSKVSGIVTTGLNQTVTTVSNLTQTVVSKILPDDNQEDGSIEEDLPPATESLIQNPTGGTVSSDDLIQEDDIAGPIELKLIEGANPLTID